MTSTTIARVLKTDSTSWQDALRNAVRDIGELAALLDLDADSLAASSEAGMDFPLLVPHSYVARMRKGDAKDPLLLQILPTADELEQRDGFEIDPLAEHALAEDGLMQKYPNRALLITTGACPVHCRYCFRRSFPYSTQTASGRKHDTAIDTLRASRHIKEVILSGGDPLSLSNARLSRLVADIETAAQVTTLRIHTRFPVMLPERVDDGLIELLEASRLDTVVVLHTNHANELDVNVAEAVDRLKPAARCILNQSVLLRGINDSCETLLGLSARLLECGIVPYYLHLLDPVAGAGHFYVDAAVARSLIESMRRQAPGYLVPRLVREIPGRLSKTPLDLTINTPEL